MTPTMPSLNTLLASLPVETLAPGTHLTTEGTRSGQLYILESGKLTVKREGIALATIEDPGAIIGEMAVLLGIPHSATVVAEDLSKVRVVNDALGTLSQNADFAVHLATIACARLNATSALLVEMKGQAAGKAKEQALMSRILMALAATPKGAPSRAGWVDHE
jgi:CRP/FNR family transcriptional regulator, cyclic AMP receptor protein